MYLSHPKFAHLSRYASAVRFCRHVSYLSFCSSSLSPLLIAFAALLPTRRGGTRTTAFVFESLSGTLGFDCVSGDNIRPADQSPMLLDTSTESDLFTDSRAGRICEGQFCGIGLDAHNLRTRCR